MRAGHLKKIFQMIDKDGNGMITIEELRTAAEQVHTQDPIRLLGALTTSGVHQYTAACSL